MIILSFETTHETASVALYLDGFVREKEIHSDKRHEETVMPAAEEFLRENGLCPEDIDAIAVDIGPGSFTGVRIGVCHANAMAFALGVPCFGVSSLEIMAYPYKGRKIAVSIDAGNGNCYGAIYDESGTAVASPESFANEEFRSLIKTNGSEFSVELPCAGNLARIAAERANASFFADSQAAPLYLRPSQAERNIRK